MDQLRKEATVVHYHREGLAAVSNIENGIFQLQLFRHKRDYGIPEIESIIASAEEPSWSGDKIDPMDEFRLKIFKMLLAHLKELK